MPATRDALIIAILFLLPGFVADTLYGQRLNRPKRDATELLLGVLVWSLTNYVLFSWLVVMVIDRASKVGYTAFFTRNATTVALVAPLVLLLAPAIQALALRQLMRWRRFEVFTGQLFLAPVRSIPKAWDWVFSREVDYLVLITLTDGTRFGAGWGRNSFSSTFPSEEGVYFEVLYSIDEAGKFGTPVPLTRGILLNRSDIRSLEFYIARGGEQDDQQTEYE